MSTPHLPPLASLRRQQLLIEFGGLQAVPPEGVYVSLTPGDRSLWTGVMFIRKGPYASAVLRFQIRFPPSYPDLPPLVTFATDIFHPLLVPLTTYTFTTGSSDTDTVSATDEERLPPGGFSLRHGFPQWFGRAKRAAGSQVSSRNVSGGTPTDSGSVSPSSTSQTFDLTSARTSTPVQATTPQRTPVSKILEYIRSTFDDASVLDAVPLEAAGNPSAWHAWRAHRKIAPRASEIGSETESRTVTVAPVVPDGLASPKKRASAMATVVRQPGDWNWEGVWTKRARAAIEASISEPVLFGGNYRGADDALIQFSPLEDEVSEKIRETIIPTEQGIAQ